MFVYKTIYNVTLSHWYARELHQNFLQIIHVSSHISILQKHDSICMCTYKLQKLDPLKLPVVRTCIHSQIHVKPV